MFLFFFSPSQVIGRTSDLLDASNEQKRSCELTLEQKQRQITKLDTAFKSASQEVMKVRVWVVL